MPTTPNLAFRYPALSNAPNIPQDMQNLASDVDTATFNLKAKLATRLTQGTAQTGWTTGTYTTITFGTEDFDWGTIHDPVTNASRINIGVKLGLWEVSGMYAAAVNNVCSNHRARMIVNGSQINGGLTSFAMTTSGFVCIPIPTQLVLATVSTDYVEMQGYMVAGSGTLGTTVSTEVRCMFQAVYIGTQS